MDQRSLHRYTPHHPLSYGGHISQLKIQVSGFHGFDHFDGMLTAKIPFMYMVCAKARNCLAKITVCSFISCKSALDHW